MMKKIISLLLMLAMLLLSSVPAMAATTRTSGLYTYEIKGNGTAVITDFDWDANGTQDVFVPQMLDGYTVTAIADFAFCPYDTVDEVLMLQDTHRSYTYPGKDCKVTIADTITMIGEFSFACLYIDGFYISENLTSIGNGAFAGCNHCTFSIAPEHPTFALIANAIYNKGAKELISAPTYSGIRTIPEGIISIADYAFIGCNWSKFSTSLLNITLPSTLQSVGNYAFKVVRYGKDFIINAIPDSVETIGDYGFSGCRFDVDPVFSSALTYLGIGAFSGCRDENFVIDENCRITEIPNSCFSGVHSISIDCKYISTIGDHALSGAKIELKNTDRIRRIGKYAFVPGYSKWNQRWSDFVLSPQVTTIPEGFSVEGFTLPDTVKKIEYKAYVEKVTNFYLPASITSIDEEAFVSGSTFVVERNSYAETWASENGFQYTYSGGESLDWLNN